MNYTQLPFISKVNENQQAFGEKVIQISDEMGIQPSWLMIVMNNESGVNSHIENYAGSGATGLIQFMPATAINLGTTVAALKSMSNVDQLDYVKKYFTQYGYNKKVKDVGDLYLAVFFPIALYRNDDWVFPSWAVDANRIFDVNGDGTLTKAEFKQYVNNKYGDLIPKEETEVFLEKKKNNTIIIISVVAIVLIVGGFAVYYFTQRK